MKRKRKLQERLNAISQVLLGILVGMCIAAIFIIRAFAESDEEILTFEHCERIPLEEQIEHDLEVKYQEWLAKQNDEETKYLIDVTQEDIDLMARVVMSEGSVLPFDAKQAIAQTIVNRVRTDFGEFKNLNSVSEVVFYPNAYSTQDNGEPNDDCYRAVEAALMYEGFPTDMYWFREDHYHDFGTDYCNIGTTYFSRGISNGFHR